MFMFFNKLVKQWVIFSLLILVISCGSGKKSNPQNNSLPPAGPISYQKIKNIFAESHPGSSQTPQRERPVCLKRAVIALTNHINTGGLGFLQRAPVVVRIF